MPVAAQKRARFRHRRRASATVQPAEAAHKPSSAGGPSVWIAAKTRSATGGATAVAGEALRGEHDLRPRRPLGPEIEATVELVADESADDREPRAVAVLAHAVAR